MKPAAFAFCAAADIAQTLQFLSGHNGAAKPIAGGQSLGPMLNMRLVRAAGLADVSRLTELRAVKETDAMTRIGAAITHAEIEDGEVADPTGGWMRAAAANIAHRAVRNRGTIGGSLVHADPAADWVIVMIGLCSHAVVGRPGAEQRIPMEEFISGPFETTLEDGALLLAVDIPKPARGAKWGYWKFTRQVGEFAKASATVLIDRENDRQRCVVGALGRQPLVLENAEALIDGSMSSRDALTQALPNRTEADLTLHITALTRALAQARNAEDWQP